MKIKKKDGIYVSKKCCEKKNKHGDLLLIVEEGKRHYIIPKYFNTLMHELFAVIVYKFPVKKEY